MDVHQDSRALENPPEQVQVHSSGLVPDLFSRCFAGTVTAGLKLLRRFAACPGCPKISSASEVKNHLVGPKIRISRRGNGSGGT